MRKLDEDFFNKFDNEFKFVIDYVKKNKDVFLGIRNNLVDLYVNGGCFFTIEKTAKGYKGNFNIDGYGKCLSCDIINKMKNISDKELDDRTIGEWKNILDDLKNRVGSYMEGNKRSDGKVVIAREKILQQKLAREFNNSNSKYYTYDIEYNVESLNDYYFLLDEASTKVEFYNKRKNKKQVFTIEHTPAKNLKDEKGNVKNQTLGRVDNMVIEIKENKVYFKLMEVKEGTNAIKAIEKNTGFYGNGIIGHVNQYMKIIDYVKNNKEYPSLYRKENGLEPCVFDIRWMLMEEVKHIMSFYKKYGLINNPNFNDKDIDYKNLEFGDIELVFYLGGYNMNSQKLENHLGLNNNQADSVVNLINREYSEMKYDYINEKQIYDFKYHKDAKGYVQNLSLDDLDIKSYNQVKVKRVNNKIELFEEN